jgi:hypothetical protein
MTISLPCPPSHIAMPDLSSTRSLLLPLKHKKRLILPRKTWQRHPQRKLKSMQFPVNPFIHNALPEARKPISILRPRNRNVLALKRLENRPCKVPSSLWIHQQQDTPLPPIILLQILLAVHLNRVIDPSHPVLGDCIVDSAHVERLCSTDVG